MIQRLVGMRKRKGRATASALALCAAALAYGCARPAPPPVRYLQVDIETSPIATDPRFATDAISSRIMELIFDSMVKSDRNGRLVGDLAESIERPDDTRIIFHLKPGIRFSDGRELTSRDVKFTYDSILDPWSGSPKRAGLEQLKSIEIPDQHTVVITTARPYAPALEMGTYGIVPAGTPLPRSSVAVSPLGTGPFTMTKYQRDDSAWLKRNPYRPAPANSPEGIVFKIVPDATVRALELAEGVCDVAPNNIDPEVLSYLISNPELRLNETPGTSYAYLLFNFRNPQLRDLRVRRAIAYAIDRAAIVGSYLRGTARIASGMLVPENWAYDGKVRSYGYDPEMARQLLDDAGYHADRNGMRALKFTYKTTPENSRLGEVLQAMLRRVGIRVEIRSNEWATFYSDLANGNFDLASMRWIGINDPNHYYLTFDSLMVPPRGLNRGAYSNPEMDALVEAGMSTIDPASRRSVYRQVQRLAADDLPYVSLWWLQNVTVLNREVAGFEAYPNGSLRSLASVTLVAPSASEATE
jgi:peptide/nickel transport system substrate-binding protein